jgi:Flp pilus assembly protein TadD
VILRSRPLQIVCAAAALAAILLGFAVFVRRGSPPPPAPTADAERVDTLVRSSRGGRPVIFVGLDGADWELLDGYVAAGLMPNLASLTREGTAGVLTTIHPPLSPLVWTTMLTGRSPLEHGILDFTRFAPGTGRKEPITSDERRVPAVWNMASAAGKRVASFGFWATFPAENVNGLLVSDRLFSFLYAIDTPPAGVVFPPSSEAWARQALKRAEDASDLDELKRFLPWLTEGEYSRRISAEDPYAHPVSALRRILIETRVYHDLATHWLESQQPDLTAVYIQGTDSIGHVFASYAPPRQPSVSEEDYRRYSGVPELYFRHIDTLLGDYKRLARARGAVLMLASDHGFRWREGRPTALSSLAHATAAKWHRDEGLYVLWGSAIPAGHGHDAKGSIEQVCATLLALLGIPPGAGLSGPVLPGTPVEEQPAVDYARHYHPSPTRDAGGHAAADSEALEKLRALGYVGGAEAKAAPAGATSTRTGGSYNNEGLILRARGDDERARAAFEKALTLDPDLASALWNLSDLLFARGLDKERADELLLRAFAKGLPEGTRFVVGRAIGYQRDGQTQRSLKLMESAAALRPEEPELWLFCGRYRVERGDCNGALTAFSKAVGLAPANPASHASQGVARLCLGDRQGARLSFQRSLQLDPNQPKVRAYLERL